MANLMKNLKVLPNSTSLEEARKRTFDFFRLACRSIPSVMDIYNLNDVVSPSQLRSSVASEIRKNSHVTNPKVSNNWKAECKVIDLLLFKGMEELKNVVDHAKQRHHIIGQYVVGRKGLVQDLGPKDEGISNFLKNFYNSNYY